MIEEERIQHIKANTDLVSLVRSKGVQLKKNGKGYKGPCPFHEDDDPSFSVNPEKNLWNCFGCDKGGDVIRFVELIANNWGQSKIKSYYGTEIITRIDSN